MTTNNPTLRTSTSVRNVRPHATLLLPFLCSLILTACTSTEPRYFTLTPVAKDPMQSTLISDPHMEIEVSPMIVPSYLTGSRVVVRDPTKPAKLRFLEYSRWSAPLPDELRHALSWQLRFDLGAGDTYYSGSSAKAVRYRVTTELCEPESASGQDVQTVVDWEVRRIPDESVITGRTLVRWPSDQSDDATLAGYRLVIRTLADDISNAVKKMEQVSHRGVSARHIGSAHAG